MSGRIDELASKSFTETLYEWMQRTPWLALSAAAHLILFVVLAMFPWQVLKKDEPKLIVCEFGSPEIHEELPDPVEPPPEPTFPEDHDNVEEMPTLVDNLFPNEDTDVADTSEGFEGESDALTPIDFGGESISDVLGIGGPAAGKYKGRMGKGSGGPRATSIAVQRGLAWLAAHQSPDGSWDADGFDAQCGAIGGTICEGHGEATHDVGLTGLALLAFLADGSTTRHGPYKENVVRGIKWLRDVQDPDEGLFGEPIGHAFLYNHAIASLAVCEAYYFSKSPLIRATAQRAVRYVEHARNPYGVWRYDVPPIGENDTSVTGWMVFVLAAAEDAGIGVDPQAFTSALTWFDEVTDPATGRVGYVAPGSESSRIPNVNDHFPANKGEAMTAVALLSRFFLGQTPDTEPLMDKHADLLLGKLPEWDPDGFGCDMYYWYYGTYAMYQMGGRHWRTWQRAMTDAVQNTQREDGDARGSWDPVGPWGFAGGRVYSTAMMVLCLEVYERYSRISGARDVSRDRDTVERPDNSVKPR